MKALLKTLLSCRHPKARVSDHYRMGNMIERCSCCGSTRITNVTTEQSGRWERPLYVERLAVAVRHRGRRDCKTRKER